MQETADTIYLVLPPARSADVQEAGELSDQELEAVAGGSGWTDDCTRESCATVCGFCP